MSEEPWYLGIPTEKRNLSGSILAFGLLMLSPGWSDTGHCLEVWFLQFFSLGILSWLVPCVVWLTSSSVSWSSNVSPTSSSRSCLSFKTSACSLGDGTGHFVIPLHSNTIFHLSMEDSSRLFVSHNLVTGEVVSCFPVVVACSSFCGFQHTVVCFLFVSDLAFIPFVFANV